MPEVEAFVQRAVAERSASVLAAGPQASCQALLRAWTQALGAERVHVVAIVSDVSAWPAEAERALISAVGHDAERTPEQLLRGALRQDPDVIVCEGATTAALEILVQAVLTGHQVLASLESLDDYAAALPDFLRTHFHVVLEADAEGVARLIRFAPDDAPHEVVWDRAQAGPLPAELPGRPRPSSPAPETAAAGGPPTEEPPAEAVVAAARAALVERLRPTWTPVLAEPSGDAACSKLGGQAMLGPGEAWPTCPTCDQALPLLVQLDRDGLPAAAAERFPADAGWLQLFYCDSPACGCDDAWAPGGQNRLLRWLPRAGAVAGVPPVPLGDEADRVWTPADVRGWDARDEAPHVEDLTDLEPAAADACEELREYAYAVEDDPDVSLDAELVALAGPRAGDKLLGWPAWEQGAEWVACPVCSARCEPLFQLDAWRGRLVGSFAADGRGHVSSCLEHPEQLAFGWACG